MMMLEKEIILDNVMLKTSPRFKKQILQFLPEKLVEISKEKYFNWNGQKLKSAYLIDIVHNLLLKYYFKKENIFSLSSVILKDKYGYLYNFYINYLKEIEIIKIQKNYLAGSNSRIYTLNDSIIKNRIYRYSNTDKVLLKKYLTKHLQWELDNNNIIKKKIKQKLISDLYSVQIEFDRAIFFLEHIKNEDLDVYNRNKYSIEAINQKHIFYHFDSFGRMHTNFTILKSFIRKNCLLIDGEETCELDIKNSQPLFLSKLIDDSNLDVVDLTELNLFRKLVNSGTYYQYLIDNLDLKSKPEAKKLTYKVLFGRNGNNSKSDKLFKTLFPSILQFIKLYKEENSDYKILAHDLQKAESNLIFNKIIERIAKTNSKIRVITVHDSLIIQKKWREQVSEIFFEEISNYFGI